MTIELWMLLGSAGLFFVLLMIEATYTDLKMGARYSLSNRDRPKTEMGAFHGRLLRAIDNLKENLLLFAILVLVLAQAGVHDQLTEAGAVTFLAARVAHAATYLLGITVLRSLAWFAGIIGMGMMVYALLSL